MDSCCMLKQNQKLRKQVASASALLLSRDEVRQMRAQIVLVALQLYVHHLDAFNLPRPLGITLFSVGHAGTRYNSFR